MSRQQGDMVKDYRLDRMLGSGGNGEVWLADASSRPAAKVALKFANGSTTKAEVLKEMRSWSRASQSPYGHPNVVRLFGAFEHDGHIVLVTEYLRDGSLLDRLLPGCPPTHEVVGLMIGILDGLCYLHDNRIIHRDLKPGNILMDGICPKLADFGLARILDDPMNSSRPAGTPAYMAPEAFGFDHNREKPVDIWACGVIFYELLSGQLPFDGKNMDDLIRSIRHDPPHPLPLGTDRGLVRIIEWALTRDAANNGRPTADEMAHALRRWNASRPTWNESAFSTQPVGPVAVIPQAQSYSTGGLQTVRTDAATEIQSAATPPLDPPLED